MCPINYDFKMKKLQELSQKWAAQFEKSPGLTIDFSADGGLLSVNGISTGCPLSQIDAENATFEAEFFWIPTISGGEYEIYLDMPFAGHGQIGYIKHICTIYSAESQ